MGVDYIESKMALDAFLASLIEDSVAPGAVAAVCDKDGILYSWCGGWRELVPRKLPMFIETQFDLASLTKVVATTMVAVRLIDAGKLNLDARIGDFFTSGGSGGNFSAVTISQLLTHSGGFLAEERLWDNMKDFKEAVPYILHSQPQYVPGSKVLYSCFGFIVLGAVLEIVYGGSLASAADELVFRPLGMNHTAFCPSQSLSEFPRGFAATERDEHNGLMLSGVVHDENARFLQGVSGNAGCFSRMEDLIRWCRMLLNGGRTISGDRFLSERIITQFSQNLTPGLGDSRSLGFQLIPLELEKMEGKSSMAYGHTGFTGTSVFIVPERGVAAILLTNRVHPSRSEQRLIGLRPKFHELVLKLTDNS